MAKQSVLISGAGIAGVSLAYWLSRRGFEPVLLERAPRFREGGYVIDLWGLGIEIAERMGLLPVLRERGYAIDHLRNVDATGRVRTELSGTTLRGALGNRFLSILRGDLARAIYDQVEGKVEALYGDGIHALHDDGAGVEVELESGTRRRFDLVVACDGLHSKVRALAFGPEAAHERYLGYVAAAFIARGYPHRDGGAVTSYAAPGHTISRYALRDDRTAFLMVMASDEKPAVGLHDLAAQKQLLAAAFAGDAWRERDEILERLASTDELYFDWLSQIEVRPWSRGRVALAGDAAHCPSLLAGAGCAFAMAGAYILAGELQHAQGDASTAFAAYERIYRPFIDAQQKAARGFAGAFAPRSRFAIFARDQAMRLLNLPGLGAWAMRRMFAHHFTLPEYPSTPCPSEESTTTEPRAPSSATRRSDSSPSVAPRG